MLQARKEVQRTITEGGGESGRGVVNLITSVLACSEGNISINFTKVIKFREKSKLILGRADCDRRLC